MDACKIQIYILHKCMSGIYIACNIYYGASVIRTTPLVAVSYFGVASSPFPLCFRICYCPQKRRGIIPPGKNLQLVGEKGVEGRAGKSQKKSISEFKPGCRFLQLARTVIKHENKLTIPKERNKGQALRAFYENGTCSKPILANYKFEF